jgi:DNA modification methylase
LSAPGGPVTAGGEAKAAALLAQALDAHGEAEAQELTHGFHAYAARFHPLLVRRLLEGVPRGRTLLDPFVGSGTTLVEGVTRGLRTFGVDVNPLAIALCRLKATPWPFERRMPLADAAREVAERSLSRVAQRARTRTSGSEYDDPQRYAPHVFRELVGLREEISSVEDKALREPLALILSSIVLKVSRRTSATRASTTERAIGKGLPTRLFLRRAEELVAKMAELAAAVPAGTPAPDVRLGDARALNHIRNAQVDVVITSPPYLGTYDYAEHQAPNWGWLAIERQARAHAEAREIGARRGVTSADRAVAAWQKDTDAFVAELARVAAPDAKIYVSTGDSFIGARAVAGDHALRAAAAACGLTVVAWAAQARPSFYAPSRTRTRREHLLLLGRSNH